ncbi:MAG: CoA-binding protein [Deltaproteobacteria bacterium]|nr:CoA-binding protein [Deltaproteobacteria bacterium]
MEKKTVTSQLHDLFNPKSVAVVGLPRGMKSGKLFLIALQDLGYSGDIYPVHPKAREIDGIRAYPRVSAIPGEVDLAIILVPHQSALPVVRDCAAKGVKGAVLFTAGYKETGTDEGKALEAELSRIARDSGMRLFGPNCMGLYSPRSGLSFFPELSKKQGPVGFISHSGSLANIIGRIGPQKGIYFSKAASLGNECDLNSADLLAYLGDDPDTGVIGAYLEGIKDGPAFLKALKETSRKKPVVLWKVGLTPEGNQAAASHTGALGGSREIWNAVVHQGGAIPVNGFDVLIDTLMGFSLLPPNLGDRIAILSGPGGLAVAAAEACGNAGLALALLSSKTRAALAQFIPPTGTSLTNPIDVGLSAYLEIDIYTRAAEVLSQDPNVDSIVVVGRGMTHESNRLYTDTLIQCRRESGKPFMVINIPGLGADFAMHLCQSGVPFFDTVERAMAIYERVRAYQLWQRGGQT